MSDESRVITPLYMETISFLVDQYSYEIHNSLSYRFFSGWLFVQGYKNLANYYADLAYESMDKANNIHCFLQKGGVWFYRLLPFSSEFKDINLKKILEKTLELVIENTERIKAGFLLAEDKEDLFTRSFLETRLHAQFNEESCARQKLNMLENGGEFSFDNGLKYEREPIPMQDYNHD